MDQIKRVATSHLTKEEIMDIERVQKAFLHVCLGNGYVSYQSAMSDTKLETLEQRRTKLCTTFAVKAVKHPKHKHWFVKTDPDAPDTRSNKPKYKTPLFRLGRFRKSPIPYLTGLLNFS